jgi:hypothetical protein
VQPLITFDTYFTQLRKRKRKQTNKRAQCRKQAALKAKKHEASDLVLTVALNPRRDQTSNPETKANHVQAFLLSLRLKHVLPSSICRTIHPKTSIANFYFCFYRRKENDIACVKESELFELKSKDDKSKEKDNAKRRENNEKKQTVWKGKTNKR